MEGSGPVRSSVLYLGPPPREYEMGLTTRMAEVQTNIPVGIAHMRMNWQEPVVKSRDASFS
jgi:hypothetical protein